MKLINWSGYEWITQERWGQIHPEKPWNWYDPSCVKINERGNLELWVKKNPTVIEVDDDYIYSNNGTGLINCTTDFSHGVFEIVAKLPKGRGMWPAFWMWATNDWPPEIDIFEGYSGKRNYRNWCLKPQNIKSCIHIRNEWNVKKIPARSPWIWQFNNNPAESFNTYTCVWDKDKIEFIINNRLLRVITCSKTLNYLNQYNMQLVINNHIDGLFQNDWSCKTPFEIKSFKYEKI